MADFTPYLQGLTDKERIFCEALLKGMSKKAALVAAGIKPTAGPTADPEDRPHVQEALRKCRKLSADEAGWTRDKVAKLLEEAYRNSTTAAEQIMAARELGKLYGLYAPEKVDVSHKVEKVGHERDLKSLTMDELKRLAQMDKGIVLEGEFEVVAPKQLSHG